MDLLHPAIIEGLRLHEQADDEKQTPKEQAFTRGIVVMRRLLAEALQRKELDEESGLEMYMHLNHREEH